MPQEMYISQSGGSKQGPIRLLSVSLCLYLHNKQHEDCLDQGEKAAHRICS